MFNFGVDYYPEQWPSDRWAIDARLMAEAGFNVVRLAEFAWAKMEPSNGHFDFSWLDEAISVLSAHDIRVILGTPTASPPAWLMAQYPDAFRVRGDGVRVTYGNRREYCPNNPAYQEHSRRIVEAMADHYASHSAIIGWQIDNEFGERCYCPVCLKAFQDWLGQRYDSLDSLNDKWGTTFWSHNYANWSEIPSPATTGHSPNPALALDYYRFCSDSYVAYQQIQIDILRDKCPQHFITHNLMGFGYDKINYFDLVQNLDFVSWDNYRRMQWTFQTHVDPARAALDADTMRGLKGKNFWVMEQQAGSGGWEVVSVAPRPGELRLWAYQSIAHGADGILFFRWRTARYGTEQYWHGLLDHDATPGRRYQEIKQMGAELKAIGDKILGSTVKPPVAMLLSYDSRFAFEVQANNPDLHYSNYFYQIYRGLHDLNVSVDVIAPTDDLSAYKLVVAPLLHIVTPQIAANLESFVKNGGTLLTGLRSGVKDEDNAVVNTRLPGLLSSIVGIQVEEYDSLTPDMGRALQFVLPELEGCIGNAAVWCDILAPIQAEAVAVYTSNYYAGKPAITQNRYGNGRAIYVGTVGDGNLYASLLPWLLHISGVNEGFPALGLEITERWQGDKRLLFILNHTEMPQEIKLETLAMDLFNDLENDSNSLLIQPRDVRILEI